MKHTIATAHIRDIADESGIDLDAETAVSCEATVGGIETWYQESAIWRPWRAFKAGVGTYSGWTREEAIACVRAKC